MTYANESETEPLALALREVEMWRERAEKAEAKLAVLEAASSEVDRNCIASENYIVPRSQEAPTARDYKHEAAIDAALAISDEYNRACRLVSAEPGEALDDAIRRTRTDNPHPGDWDRTAIESHCAKCECCQAYKKMADDEAVRHATRANGLAFTLQTVARMLSGRDSRDVDIRELIEAALRTPAHQMDYVPPAKGERGETVILFDGREGKIDASWRADQVVPDRMCCIGFDYGEDGYARRTESHLLSTLRSKA